MFYTSLDTRCQIIIDYLLRTDGYFQLEDISKLMNISKRSLYYDVSKINDWLSAHNISVIQPERQKGILITSSQKGKIRKELESLTCDYTRFYIYSPEERLAIIVCAILVFDKPVHIEKLVELCSVSRNTILNDLRILKREIAKYDSTLIYENKTGYDISSEVIKKRALFLYYLSSIINLVKQRLVNLFDNAKIQHNFELLREIEAKLETEYVEGILYQLAVLISVARRRNETFSINNTDEANITQRKEYILVQQYFPELNHSEQIYFTIQLLGARVQVTKSYVAKSLEDQSLLYIAENMVHEFEQLACIEFNNKDELINKLYIHLSISLYRYRYGIVEGNPLAKDIEENYPELFEITRKVADSLSKTIGYPITKNEVAYLTLHFGAHLRRSGNKKGVIRVLLVCPNGISTAYMLKKELEDLNPLIEIIDIVSLKELDGYTGIFDFIVSSVGIKHKKRVICVHPVLTTVDKQNILSYIFKLKGVNGNKDETDRVFSRLKEYVPENYHDEVYKLLQDHFSQKCSVSKELYEKKAPGINELLTVNRLQIADGMSDWKEAIQIAANPIINEGFVNNSYVDAMVKCIETFGSYIFLSPDIALAHAKPEDGVLQLSMSLLISSEGVNFPGNAKARVIIVIAPVDNESHLKALREIVDFFTDQSNLVQILNAKDVNDAYKLLSDFTK